MPNSNATTTLPDNAANLMYRSGFGEQEASEIFRGFSRQGCYPSANASVLRKLPDQIRGRLHLLHYSMLAEGAYS
jgi:hypothetical protein